MTQLEVLFVFGVASGALLGLLLGALRARRAVAAAQKQGYEAGQRGDWSLQPTTPWPRGEGYVMPMPVTKPSRDRWAEHYLECAVEALERDAFDSPGQFQDAVTSARFFIDQAEKHYNFKEPSNDKSDPDPAAA